MEFLHQPMPGPGARLWLEPLEGGNDEALSREERAWGWQLAPTGRRRYWQSRAAMRQVLAPVLSCRPAEVPLHSPPGAPPQLLADRGWVSLSHSADGLLIGFAPDPIGVDLERADRPLDAASLLQRFFPAEEVAELQGLAGEPLRLAVLTSWVAKEAAIKGRRRSLAMELGQWCFDHRRRQLHHQLEGLRLVPHLGMQNGWLWALVMPGQAPILGP